MPFKRKARVLFASSTPDPAETAARYANSVGAAWLSAYAATPQCSGHRVAGSEFNNTCLALGETLSLDLDLIITLDEEVISHCPDWPGGPRRRHYPISSQGIALIAEIQRLIDGIIGGFKLLEKTLAK